MEWKPDTCNKLLTLCVPSCAWHQEHQYFSCVKCFGNICLRSKLLKTTFFYLIIHVHLRSSNSQIYRENEAIDWCCLWLTPFQKARVIWKSVWLFDIAHLSSPPTISLTVGHHSPFTLSTGFGGYPTALLLWNGVLRREQLQLFLRGTPVPLILFLLVCHVQRSPSGLSAVKIWRVLFPSSHMCKQIQHHGWECHIDSRVSAHYIWSITWTSHRQ